jgi:hypothetical protein
MTQLEIDIPTKEQIEKRAYELYLARGCEPGMDVEDWLAAERELTARKPTFPKRRFAGRVRRRDGKLTSGKAVLV